MRLLDATGELVNELDGLRLGVEVGASVRVCVTGLKYGVAVGTVVGLIGLGLNDGSLEGPIVGLNEGTSVGVTIG